MSCLAYLFCLGIISGLLFNAFVLLFSRGSFDFSCVFCITIAWRERSWISSCCSHCVNYFIILFFSLLALYFYVLRVTCYILHLFYLYGERVHPQMASCFSLFHLLDQVLYLSPSPLALSVLCSSSCQLLPLFPPHTVPIHTTTKACTFIPSADISIISLGFPPFLFGNYLMSIYLAYYVSYVRVAGSFNPLPLLLLLNSSPIHPLSACFLLLMPV